MINLTNLSLEEKQLYVSIIQLIVSIPGVIFVYYQLVKILNELKIKVVVGKYPEPSKEPIDSDWAIRILHPDRPIEKCRVLYNNTQLPWWNKKEPYYEKFILVGGGGNARIPKGDIDDEAEVKVMDGKKTLRKVKFKDLPTLEP